MFCRNCGQQLSGNPEYCMKCGARPRNATAYCFNCGNPTTPASEICVKCGARLAAVTPNGNHISSKSRLATTLLAIFLGVFGAHRFYLGKTRSAVAMLLLGIFGLIFTASPIGAAVGVFLLLVVGVWAFVDFIIAVSGLSMDEYYQQVTRW